MSVSSYEEQYRKREYLSAQMPWRVFILALIIFFLSVFIYLGMLFGYKPYLKSEVRSLEGKISNLNQSIDESQQKQIFTFYSQMVNIQNLLSGHKYYYPIFDFIEKNTYQNINFSDLKFTAADSDLRIEGTAPNYESLIKQITFYNQASEVEKASLDSASIQEVLNEVKKVRFSAKLILNKNMFKQSTNQQINESTSTPQQ